MQQSHLAAHRPQPPSMLFGRQPAAQQQLRVKGSTHRCLFSRTGSCNIAGWSLYWHVLPRLAFRLTDNCEAFVGHPDLGPRLHFITVRMCIYFVRAQLQLFLY